MQRQPASDLFVSFSVRDRVNQARRLIQDAIDVWQGLVMSQPDRYRGSAPGLEVREGGPDGVAVTVPEAGAPQHREIVLPDAGRNVPA